VVVCGQQTPAAGQFEQWDAFLHGVAVDAEEVLAVGLCEAAVAFGDVGGNRKGGAVQLISEEAIAAGEVFGTPADWVCEINGLLVDDQFLERDDPIDRNIRGLLTEFGDAEPVDLMAQRRLVIEASAAVPVSGPPVVRVVRIAAATPGQITTCRLESVQAESRLLTDPLMATSMAVERERRQFAELQNHLQPRLLNSHQVRDARWRLNPAASDVCKQNQSDLRTWVDEELIGRLRRAPDSKGS